MEDDANVADVGQRCCVLTMIHNDVHVTDVGPRWCMLTMMQDDVNVDDFGYCSMGRLWKIQCDDNYATWLQLCYLCIILENFIVMHDDGLRCIGWDVVKIEIYTFYIQQTPKF